MSTNSMQPSWPIVALSVLLLGAAIPLPAAPAGSRPPDGDGALAVKGEPKQWHKVTLELNGPFAHESDTDPNPFTDLAFEVTFTHESGEPSHRVPGHFAADGNAAETRAESGTVWRAHLSPDKPGRWDYAVSFTRGRDAALDGGGEPVAPWHGRTGSFGIAPTDKTGRDFRAEGRLQYVGGHHLRFAGSRRFFLKAGPDSPETFLAYADFDGTEAGKKQVPPKTWEPHVRDWREGDPTWQDGKGKGMIGALNYLASVGCNAFSFLTYNAGGDGDNVWPFVRRDAKRHYDCSKLDQWGIVFDHATALGLYCHFKLQETENDDERQGSKGERRPVPAALDGGNLGPERKLYLRELVSRYGHLLALNWNLGEENTQTTDEQRAMADYLAKVDPYQHLRVLHTYPGQQDKVYAPLLGGQSSLTGVSLQIGWNQTHREAVEWIAESARAGKPWVVANDEQGGADTGVPPDLGYRGYDGKAEGKRVQTPDDIRKHTLWGNLMAGGAGVEYYFGYKLPENDLRGEDFRSREGSWRWAALALRFFEEEKIPFWEMTNADALVGNEKNHNDRYCLAKPGAIYLVYLPEGGAAEIDLGGDTGAFSLHWFHPRDGGPLRDGGRRLTAGAKATLAAPDDDDWLAVLRR
jgi:hypothetical protein